MAHSDKAIVELVFDLSSPFSYIALVSLVRYRAAWNLELDLTPVYGPLLYDVTGDGQPIPLAIKNKYYDRDIVRLTERWGVDIRTPPGFPLTVTTLPVMNFLRIVKENESSEALLQSTLLLFNELYSVQTPLGSSKLYDCLVSSSPASSYSPFVSASTSASAPIPATGPFTRSRLAELLSLSTSPGPKAAKEAMSTLGKYAWEKRGAFALPWMIAYRVPIEKVGGDKIVKEGRESDVFWGCDRFEHMGYYLGPEYVWRGPWPDGRERFRPRAEGSPGTPIEYVYPPAARL